MNRPAATNGSSRAPAPPWADWEWAGWTPAPREPGTPPGGAPAALINDVAPPDEVSRDGRDFAVVATVSRVSAERVEWVWYGRIPAGMLSVLDGDPSVGKSTLTLDFAARVSRGRPWPDGAPCPCGDVLLLSAEDSLAATIRPRLEAAGADLDRVHALLEVALEDDEGRVRRVPPSLPRDFGLIEAVVRRHGVRLLVIDVLMAYLSGRVDSHRDQDVRGVLHELAAMAHRTGAAVLLVRHLNKAGGASPLYRGGGSIGIIGAARAGLLAARDPDDESEDRRVLAVSKQNLCPEPPALAYRLVGDPARDVARVEWEDAPTAHRAADLLRGPAEEDAHGCTNEAVDWLRDYLAERGGEANAADLLRAARRDGLAERTMQRARQRAGVTTGKSGMRGGWVWRLPSHSAVTERDGVGGVPGAEGANLPPKMPKMPTLQDTAPSAPSGGGVAPSGRPAPDDCLRPVTDSDSLGAEAPEAVDGLWAADDPPLPASTPCHKCGRSVEPLRARLAFVECAACYLAATR